MKNHYRKYLLALPLVVLCCPAVSRALPASSADLWDVSQGTAVTGTSGALHYSDSYRSYVENIFGASGGIEGSNTLFKDYMSPYFTGGPVPAGYAHYVEWNTPADVTIRSFNLLAYNEGMDRRAFNHFELYADTGSGWQSLFQQDFAASPENPDGYGGSPTNTDSNWLELEVDLSSPVTAQDFRAEFIQAPWTSSNAIGPRVLELDGYDTFLDGSSGAGNPIPEPTTMLLFGSGLIGLAGLARRSGKK